MQEATSKAPWTSCAKRWEEPPNGQTHFSLGSYLFKAGRFEEAAKHLRRSLDLFPNSANSRFYLAKISESEGDLGRAEEIYREIVNLRPNHAHAHAALGRLALKNGRFQQAEELLKHSIRLDPGLPAGSLHAGSLVQPDRRV